MCTGRDDRKISPKSRAMGFQEGSPMFYLPASDFIYSAIQKYSWPVSKLHFHSSAEDQTPTDVNGSHVALQHFENVPLNV